MFDRTKNILVLAPVEGELNAFLELLEPQSGKLGPYSYYTDELTNKSKLYCVQCGVGKVNAAAAAAAFISQKDFNIGFALNTGTAGSLTPKVRKGDIVVGTSYCQHDYDLTGLFADYKIGQMMEKNYVLEEVPPELIKDLPTADNIHFGTILSGDRFIDRALEIDHCKPLAVEMESAAISHICYYLYRIPFMAVRSITDSADGDAHEQWLTTHAELSHIAAQYSKEVIKTLYQSGFVWERPE